VAVAASGSSAAAAPHGEYVPSVQIGYTDSATPRQAYDWAEGVDMPLGSSLDEAGLLHTSRVYATFDLARYEGKKVTAGWVGIRERSAADCSLRAIEIWRTRAVETTPTWRRPPAPQVKVDEILTASFCPASIVFDVGAAVTEAVARKQRRITFEIRVPEQHEGDPAYGRRLNWYNSVSLSVEYNTPPTVDGANLYNGGYPCSQLRPYRKLGGFANSLQVRGLDADPGDERNIRTDVEIWPTDEPAARAVFSADSGLSGRANGVSLPDGALTDGRSYAWRARVGDGADDSAWSKRCFFTYDATRPPVPTIQSANYPPASTAQWTPRGEPGRFTFSGNGNRDVAGFHYSWSELGVPVCEYSGEFGQLVCPEPFSLPGTVRANAPGGSASVLLNPDRAGPQTLTVRSLDAAGNISQTATYEVNVTPSGPTIQVVGDRPEWGQEVHLRVSPATGVTGVYEYAYKLDGEEVQTVAADEDGIAHIWFVASDPEGHQVEVRSRSANGFVSVPESWFVYFDPWPGVRSAEYPSDGEPAGGVGVAGTFEFSPPPGWTDVAAYRYIFDFEGDFIDVPAGADGRATITWAPARAGYTTLMVHAVRPDGRVSDYANFYSFQVAGDG
jgi:hypothetical protein